MLAKEEIKRRQKELKDHMPPQELHLWLDFLRAYPVRFRRQHYMEGYFLDFFCAKAWLAIELDGDQHYEPGQRAYDEERTRFLNWKGISVVRYRNMDIDQHFPEVCAQIDAFVHERLARARTRGAEKAYARLREDDERNGFR